MNVGVGMRVAMMHVLVLTDVNVFDVVLVAPRSGSL